MDSHTLKQLEAACQRSGDYTSVDKIRQLQDKLASRTFIIAFCGHFSAGKSTMINSLLGNQVLPASPIPTSANVVTLEAGEANAWVHKQDGTHFDIAVAELEKLRELAKNGEEIRSIRIQHPTGFLPEQVQLMDTPGIDSTDDAHKVATESALHLADLVIYTMDYNHVQSEVNFNFTKTMKDRGKAVWLVINQIDKHNAFELPFAEYQRSVRDSFAAWGIEPDGIFYTTMLEPEHPYNQFPQLQESLQELFRVKDKLLEASIQQSAHYVVEEHIQFCREQNSSMRERLLAVLAGEPAVVAELEARVNLLRQELEEQQAISGKLQAEMEQELHALIENANLTPFQTTELAGAYLESRRPGFKVGFLFAGGKTEQERSNRLQQLYADFAGRVSANLDWHSKDLLVKLPERYAIRNEEYASSVYAAKVELTSSMLADWVKEGALASQEYMYQYAKDISSEVKGMYRLLAAGFIHKAVQLAAAEAGDKVEAIAVRLHEAETLLEAAKDLLRLEQQEQDIQTEMLELLDAEGKSSTQTSELYAVSVEAETVGAEAEQQVSGEGSIQAAGVPSPTHVTPVPADSQAPAAQAKTFKAALMHTASKLRTASAVIENLPGMHTIAKTMHTRADRLEQNLFTVALFGAFSAGKSSFANALMGDMVLPVSPNPTTAVINKILPPTAEWPHGSVRVKLKSFADMAADIKASLAVFGAQVEITESKTFFADVLEMVGKLTPEQIQPAAKPHFSFLKAVEKGLTEAAGQLGSELRVDMDTFREYVAKEWKACFVEWIELYYDCPLTAQGIVLIDTPGADSINARHTKVAFDYIKNADAVLFVTYYNHAFSNADREFLIQLGRVKDTFELDKMFFLVNAADLAADEEELAGVITHVRKNLIACGISMPRIYSVSSQMALLAKLADKGALPAAADRTYRKLTGTDMEAKLPLPETVLADSGLAGFEADFLSFTIEELTDVAVESGLTEIRRSVSTLREFIETAKQGESVRQAQRDKLRAAAAHIKAAVSSKESESEVRSIEKEVDELVYYVNQRIFLRYIEAFNESFSSSVLREDAGNIKQLLQNSLQELLRFLVFDLGQEMRATAVRIEKQLNRSAGRIFEQLAETVCRELPGCTLEPYQKRSFPTPEFPEKLAGVEVVRFADALALYKNAKDFFERNTKAAMREEIEKLLQEPVADYLQNGRTILKEAYLAAFLSVVDSLKQDVLTETDEYVQGVEAALSMQVDVAEMERMRERLEELL